MNKQCFYAILTCIVVLILIGCGGTSGYKTDAESVVYTSVRAANDGRLAETITPSKFKIAANNEKTLAPNVEVVVSEKDAKGDESEYFNTASKIYTVSSIYNGNNQVKLLEKPFVITIPNLINSTDVSNFYIGVRENTEVAWSYARINDVNNTSVRAAMTAKEFTFEVYKASFQTALFAQLPSSKNKKSADVKVDNITVEIEPDRFWFDKKTYTDDITVHASLTGENISNLKNSDVVFKVYYLTSYLEQFDLNVEDATVNTVSIADLKPGEGSGDKYTNYFVVTNPKLENISDNLSELRFCIKTKGKASYETFPKLFNIEIFSPSTSKILSFYYNCSVKLKELAFINAKLVNKLIDVDEPIRITFDGEIAKNVDFSKYVTVYGPQNNKIVGLYSYVDKILTITPKSNLEYNSTYSISISDSLPTASEAFKLNSFFAEFKTKEEIKKQESVLLTVKLDNSDDLPVDSSLKLIFSGDLSEKAVFSDYVSIVDSAKNTVTASFSYSNRILLIKPTTNLNYDAEYTVLIKEGLPTASATTNVKSETFTFHTQTKLVEPTKPTVVVTSPSEFSKLDFLPTFVLKFSKPMQTSTQKAVSIKQKSNDAIADLIYTWSDSNKTLTVTPKNKLNQGTDYTFCFDVTKSVDIENQRIEYFNQIDFKTKTIPPITVSMIWPDSNDVAIDSNVVLEFSEPINWSNDDISKITINNGAKFVSSRFEGKKLTLDVDNLKYDTEYNICILDGIKNTTIGKEVLPPIQPFKFITTKHKLDVLVSITSNYLINGKALLKPFITLNFNETISEIDRTKAVSSIKLNDKSLSEFNATAKFDEQLYKIVTVEFSEPLSAEREFSINVRFTANNNAVYETQESFCFITTNKALNAACDILYNLMIKCPAGSFIYGSPADELGRNSIESHKNATITKDFYLAKYETTQAQYEAIMGTNPSYFKGDDNCPVERVCWLDAITFCNKLNELTEGLRPANYKFNLPSELQWEYACRAGTTTSLNSGKNITTDEPHGICPNADEVAWYMANADQKTHPVGLKKPNAWGFHDMHGNVGEHCLDYLNTTFPDGDLIDYICTIPLGGANHNNNHNIKGGCWDSSPYRIRSASRDSRDEDNNETWIDGIRVALVYDAD